MKTSWRMAVTLVLALSMVSVLFFGYSGVQASSHTPPAQPGTPEAGTPEAAEEDEATADVVDPPVAEGLAANWRVLREGEAHWYTFQHRGDRLPVHIWMDVDPNEGAGFHVFSEEEVQPVMEGTVNPNDANAIGRGTRNPVEPGYLFWRGTFQNPGTYYVMIEHGWTGNVNYSIYGAGPGLGRPAQPPVDPQAAAVGDADAVDADAVDADAVDTAAVAEPGPDGQIPGDQDPLIDPPVAEVLGANWRTLNEGEAHWYTFRHRGDQLPVHIWMDVEPNEGAGFHIFDEDEAMIVMDGTTNPHDANAIGRGTRNPVEPGYLFWQGTFEEEGLFYVMIEHGWNDDIVYTIYGAGPGLGRVAPETAEADVDAMQVDDTQATGAAEAPVTGAEVDEAEVTAEAEAAVEGEVPGEQAQLVDPPVAQALRANWRVLNEGEAHWYSFEHRGDNLPVHIWMDVNPNEGAGFHVFDENEVADVMAGTVNPNDADAVGRGTPNEEEPGHLFWRGTFENPGTYYVMIEHGWTGDIEYTIYASGSGLGR
jgi:hypothetical protein